MPNLTPPLCHQVHSRITGSTIAAAWFAPSSARGRMLRPRARRACSPPPSEPSASFTRWIHWTTQMTAMTRLAPTAVMPISAPLRGRRLPTARMSTKAATGSRGMIQALRSTERPSPS